MSRRTGADSRWIFINLRDGVGEKKKHDKYFQLYVISCTSAARRSTPPAAIQQKDLGATGDHRLNMSQQPGAHRRRRSTTRGCRSARPPRCTAAVLELLQRWSCCSCPAQHRRGAGGNPASHHLQAHGISDECPETSDQKG